MLSGCPSIRSSGRYCYHNESITVGASSSRADFNPLTASPDYILFFYKFYWNIKYQLLNMAKIKRDNNQQELKKNDHFVKSE